MTPWTKGAKIAYSIGIDADVNLRRFGSASIESMSKDLVERLHPILSFLEAVGQGSHPEAVEEIASCAALLLPRFDLQEVGSLRL
jgi:hypothetical protein